MPSVLLADPMAGVRDAWRWLLAAHADLPVAGEAATVAEALAAAGELVLAGLRFPDGSVERLIAAERRPVVVWAVLPADERADVDLRGAAAVLNAGELGDRLASVLRTSR